jgi:hypothetical protein
MKFPGSFVMAVTQKLMVLSYVAHVLVLRRMMLPRVVPELAVRPLTVWKTVLPRRKVPVTVALPTGLLFLSKILTDATALNVLPVLG